MQQSAQTGYLAIPQTTPTFAPPGGQHIPHQQVQFYPAFVPAMQMHPQTTYVPQAQPVLHPVEPAQPWYNPKYIGLADAEDPAGGPAASFQNKLGRKTALTFSILACTLALVNAALFFVWLVTTHGFPWFIYPLYGSVGFIGLLYILLTPMDRKLLITHTFVSAVVNILILSTYVFAYVPHPWFIYVLFPSAALLGLHAILTEGVFPADSLKHKWFCVHALCFFLPVNVMLFISWAATSHDGPWFIFPFFPTVIALAIHFVLTFYYDHPHKWFLLNAVTTSIVNVYLFLIWYIADAGGFPWFIFVWIPTSIPLLAHLWIAYRPFRKRVAAALPTKTGEVATDNKSTSTYAVPSSALEEGTFEEGESTLVFADVKGGKAVDEDDVISLKKKQHTPPSPPQTHS